MAKPFIQLTKNNTPFIFDNNYTEAFKKLKDQLTSSLVLYYYNPDLKSMLETDASNGVVVGVLL